jgi:hypothetical protein
MVTIGSTRLLAATSAAGCREAREGLVTRRNKKLGSIAETLVLQANGGPVMLQLSPFGDR